MSDIRNAEGNDGNSGFSDEWKRLARSDDGQGEGSPDNTERHEPHPKEGQQGPGDEPAPSEAAPLEPAPSENTDDIWAEAPEHYRAAFEAERKARERAENAIRSNNGRLSKAEREAAELRVRLAAQEPKPAAAPPEGDEAPPATEDQDPRTVELNRVAEEYEDVGRPLVNEILALREQVSALTQSRASEDEQRQVRDELEFKEYLAAQEQLLSATHGDWQEVVLQPDFVEWVTTGPQFIRDGIARNGNGIVDGAEATEILSLFKEKHGISTAPNPLAAKRERQLEGARSIPGNSPGVVPQGRPDNFQSEWKRLAAAEKRTATR